MYLCFFLSLVKFVFLYFLSTIVWWNKDLYCVETAKDTATVAMECESQPYPSFWMVPLSMILSDLFLIEWLRKIFSDTKHRAVSLRRLILCDWLLTILLSCHRAQFDAVERVQFAFLVKRLLCSVCKKLYFVTLPAIDVFICLLTRVCCSISLHVRLDCFVSYVVS